MKFSKYHLSTTMGERKEEEERKLCWPFLELHFLFMIYTLQKPLLL